ncbi:DUF2970 domain-containing protein [Thalassotalea sp. PS06]|uniref:DUF2970 domain-containing protein n=1 Tax=Thalassotalea sp. PS06 TaxID=2594005 RepID=UPI001C8F24C9|nr:DUF2970 domain-containing protein [Thalassotalea sp. PS06]
MTKMQKSDQKSNGLLRTVQSVFAAFIGVQSNKNRVDDFENGSAIQFIVVGLIAVILFVLSLVVIVSAVLPD